ncbi:kinase-like domain-containing protein, partial [Lactarius psammicola]
DRHRMILQAACLVCIGNTLLNDRSPTYIVKAIFIDQNYKATKYTLYQKEGAQDQVYFDQKNFNLTNRLKMFEFVFWLYNFFDWSRGLPSNIFTDRWFLVTLLIGEADLPTLPLPQSGHNASASGSARSWIRTPTTRGQHVPLGDDTKVFIQNEGYKMCDIRSWGSSVVVIRATTEQGHVVVLKILHNSRTTNELEILGYLQLFKSHRNHTIELLHVFQSNSVSIIVMPWKSPLDVFLRGCPELMELLWNQLLNSVWFLHDHGIAHLDLKPDNLLVGYKDLSSARLSVIDFGIAVHVKSEDTLVKGYRGTPPWSAPEIGEVAGPPMKYSAILTDRWSCG